MAIDRFVSTQFCDDVRYELGHKISLIGCYSGEMYVRPIPSVVPRLCAYLKAYTRIERPFGKVVFRIFREDASIAELAMPVKDMFPPGKLPKVGAQWQMVTAVITLSPFPVDAPCVLRVEAETEDNTPVYGGRIWISEAPADSTASAIAQKD